MITRSEHRDNPRFSWAKLHMTNANPAYDAPAPAIGLPNGTTLCGNQFTITRRLSAGGFGLTYLAEDTTLGRTIVMKECYPEDLCLRDGKNVLMRNALQTSQFRSIIDMFMREARSLAKLRHPNIVGVHRAFEENGTAYMALDLIDGHDMLDILDGKTGDLPGPERVKEILLQLLHAIETVHDHDLLHRDISPDNIIIEKTGVPVLIDFGAARGDASRRTRAISSMLVVKDGYSPQEFYMAGSIQTPSSDLYALGATFYHVLSGEAPPNSQIRMAEVAGQNPDPCEPLLGRIDGYDPAFLQAIDQAMEIVPRNRIQSAAEWRAMISDAPLETAPIAKAITDAPIKAQEPDLDRLLTRLIQETNEEVEKARPISKEPEPELAPAPKVEAKPEWLEEFNEESRRKEAVSRLIEAEQPAEEPAPHVVGPRSTQAAEEEPVTVSRPVHVANKQRRPKSRLVQSGRNDVRGQAQTAARMAERKEREDLEAELERKALNEKFRANSGLKTKIITVSYADPEAYDLQGPPSQFIGPLAKYLITGVVIGLGIVILYPNFL